MNINRLLIILLLMLAPTCLFAADKKPVPEHLKDPIFMALKDSVAVSFSEADSTRFFTAIRQLEDYLLEYNDLHTYYIQRGNEIIFLLNTRKIYEAYIAAQTMAKELREHKLDKEMYLGVTMVGHVYANCGNQEMAKKNLQEAIDLLEKEGYHEGMPAYYVNMANLEIDDHPEKALELLDKASELAEKYAPANYYDIECCKGIAYFNMDDRDNFMRIYEFYDDGKANGKYTIFSNTIEMCYYAYMGDVKAVEAIVSEAEDGESQEMLSIIYKRMGRWEDAYEALVKERQYRDSLNSVILSQSMAGIEHEMMVYEAERKTNEILTTSITVITILLVLLILTFTYISLVRRRHMRQLDKAYQHALQSDRAKSVFIQNMSHELRTPLNIIMGFAQILADPNMKPEHEERINISKMVLKNTHIITNQVDEILELSINEKAGSVENEPNINVGTLLADALRENKDFAQEGVELIFDNQLPKNFTMSTNRHLLRRMVNSLLDNACKYTTKGHITLKASTDGKELTIAVEDTGCGVDKDQAHRIFERFVKLDNFKEGLGLGLSLCRIIATRMNGSVILDSSYKGPGARFVINIPVL